MNDHMERLVAMRDGSHCRTLDIADKAAIAWAVDLIEVRVEQMQFRLHKDCGCLLRQADESSPWVCPIHSDTPVEQSHVFGIGQLIDEIVRLEKEVARIKRVEAVAEMEQARLLLNQFRRDLLSLLDKTLLQC